METVSLLRSLRLFLNPYAYVLLLSMFVGVGVGVLVIASVTKLWQSFDRHDRSPEWEGYIRVGFSVCTAVANFVSGNLSDWLQFRGVMRHATFQGVVMMVFAVEMAVVAALLHWSAGVPAAVLGVLIALQGLSFGTVLVLVPVLVCDAYGHTNFGKYFGYMQLGSSLSSIVFPLLAGVVYDVSSTFVWTFASMSVMMFVSAILLVFVPFSEANL